jgi:putative ABC transport system permease protein
MWRRKRSQQDFHREIEAHIEIEIDRLVAEGASEEDARAAAIRTFGNVTSAEERFYESQRWLWGDHLRRDLRYAARILLKSPGSSLAAIATMALGIGATCAIFSVVNAVLLRPLPYPDSSRLLMCVQRHAQFGPEVVTLPDYLDWRDQATHFESMAAAWNQVFNLTGTEEPERLPGASVTANLFRTMGTPPHIGRVLSNDAERDVVVLSYRLWQRRFSGAHDVVGRNVRLNGKPYTVIGVMPPSFSFPQPAELWAPLIPEPGMNRGYHQLWVVGRLKQGSTIDDARTDLSSIAARAEREYPANKHWGVQVSTLQDHVAGSSKRALLILSGAVGCLLLLACANVAGLLMSRSVARRQELAVRAALGAGRSRLIRQLLTESLLLSTCGGVVGLLVAAWSIKPLLSLTTLPRADEVSLDVPVFIFALLASAGTGVLFGLAPALTASRLAWRSGLTLRGAGGGARLRPVLVAFQIAVAVVLLTGAGLLMRSFHRLQQVETGFSAERVLTVRFFLPRASYPVDRCIQLYRRMIERMELLPGVETAAAVSSFPFSGASANVVFDIPGRPPAAPGEALTAEFRAATPGYFRTVGIPLMKGRDFDADSAESPFVAVVNRAFADRFYNGGDPIGHYVRILGPKPRQIVGVVGSIRHRGLDSLPEPEIYVPHTQFPTGGMFLAVRTLSEDPLTLANSVRAELRNLDAALPIARVQTWTQMLDLTLSARRFSLILLMIFSGVALILSIVGIYGMLSFNISQRTKEIGIRMAMGAAPVRVVRKAVSVGIAPVILGLAAGLLGGLGSARLLKSLLFEVRPTDPFTLAAVSFLIFVFAVVACLLPARRAAHVDPMEALRHE